MEQLSLELYHAGRNLNFFCPGENLLRNPRPFTGNSKLVPYLFLLPDKIQNSIDHGKRMRRAAGDKQINFYSI